MKQSILIIDIARCHGCNNCFMACKDEFVGNDFLPHSVSQPRHGHRWINVQKRERGNYPMVDVTYLPLTCQHCEEAPCIKKGSGDAAHNPCGVVEFELESAKKDKSILHSCPYKAVYWNEEKQTAQKCNMCIHLLEKGWKKPRCVMACPTGALQFANVEKTHLKEFAQEQSLEVLHPEYNTSPHVFYRNLHRYTKNFAGGSITYEGNCLENAQISCRHNGDQEPFKFTTSNTFGDFKIDGLESGDYTLHINYPGLKASSISIKIKDKSIFIGTRELNHIKK